MKISVVLPTNRPLGPLYAIHALSKQTFPQGDFELLVVDDHPDDRSNLITITSEHLGLSNVVVLKSKPNYWRSNRLIANARNAALIYAEGGLIVFLDDYCWVRPRWLEEHWRTHKRGYCMLGGMKAVQYVHGRLWDMDQLSPPSVEGAELDHEALMRREDEGGTESAFTRNLRLFKVSDTRSPKGVRGCWGGWFYSCNASAPMDKLIEINGFEERFDLCSEEDIDLGLRLERVGVRFWYRPDRDCTVYHVDHSGIDREMKHWSKRYRKVTYDELRKRDALESEPDEVQLIMKEAYNAKYDGSWGLHEWMRRRPPVANVVNGNKIFDLGMEKGRFKHGGFEHG